VEASFEKTKAELEVVTVKLNKCTDRKHLEKIDSLVGEKSLLRKRLATKTVQDSDCRKTIATHKLAAAQCKLGQAAH